MRRMPMLKTLFYVAALYDGVLGLAFLVAAPRVFGLVGLPPLEHYGYIHFAAALLMVFASMFLSVARNPTAHRDLIVYGMLLKLSYTSLVFYHWSAGGIADIWKPFAFADLAFLALFAWAWVDLGRRDGSAAVV